MVILYSNCHLSVVQIEASSTRHGCLCCVDTKYERLLSSLGKSFSVLTISVYDFFTVYFVVYTVVLLNHLLINGWAIVPIPSIPKFDPHTCDW